MVFSQTNAVRWIRYLVPYKNPYIQAQYLLRDFELAGQYALIAAQANPIGAARLHRSIDVFVRHEQRHAWNPKWLPAGILTMTDTHLVMKENYVRDNERGSRINITHVCPESNPNRHAIQLLHSGLVSNRYIMVRGIETSRRNQILRDKLIEKLDEYVAVRFSGPNRIICSPPKGLLIYTSKHLRCVSLY